MINCKDCKHYHEDFWGEVPGVPIPVIIAHEICEKWGDGCKTIPGGFCHFGEKRPRESTGNEKLDLVLNLYNAGSIDKAIEIVENRRLKGMWIVNKREGGYLQDMICSNCGKALACDDDLTREYKFCMNCGAEMRED